MLALLLVWVTLMMALQPIQWDNPLRHTNLWIPATLLTVLCLLPTWPGTLGFSLWLGYAVAYTLTALFCDWLWSFPEIAPLPQYQRRRGSNLRSVTQRCSLGAVLVNLFIVPWLVLGWDQVENFWQAAAGTPIVWWHFVLLPVLGDLYFTAMHQTFHQIGGLRRLHGVHHRTLLPTAWHTLDCHVIEGLFLNTLAVALPIYVVQPSFTVCYIFVVASTTYATLSHSGLVGVPGAAHHCWHHWDCTQNFGVVGLTDWILGTERQSQVPRRQVRQTQEANEENRLTLLNPDDVDESKEAGSMYARQQARQAENTNEAKTPRARWSPTRAGTGPGQSRCN